MTFHDLLWTSMTFHEVLPSTPTHTSNPSARPTTIYPRTFITFELWYTVELTWGWIPPNIFSISFGINSHQCYLKWWMLFRYKARSSFCFLFWQLYDRTFKVRRPSDPSCPSNYQANATRPDWSDASYIEANSSWYIFWCGGGQKLGPTSHREWT